MTMVHDVTLASSTLRSLREGALELEHVGATAERGQRLVLRGDVAWGCLRRVGVSYGVRWRL